MKKYSFSDIEKKIISLKSDYQRKPSHQFLHSAKERLTNRLVLTEREKAKGKVWFLSPKFGLSPAMAILIYVVGVGIGVVFASENSLPGQLFYPVKRFGESVILAASSNPEQKAYLKIEITKRRADELLELVDKGELEKAQKASEELRKAFEESKKEIDKLPEDKKKDFEKSEESSQAELEKAIKIFEKEKEEKKKKNEEVKGKKDEKKKKENNDH